jgi:hypothetical protein
MSTGSSNNADSRWQFGQTDIPAGVVASPLVGPQVEGVMKVDVRERRRHHSPYTKGNLGRPSGLAVGNRLGAGQAGLDYIKVLEIASVVGRR